MLYFLFSTWQTGRCQGWYLLQSVAGHKRFWQTGRHTHCKVRYWHGSLQTRDRFLPKRKNVRVYRPSVVYYRLCRPITSERFRLVWQPGRRRHRKSERYVRCRFRLLYSHNPRESPGTHLLRDASRASAVHNGYLRVPDLWILRLFDKESIYLLPCSLLKRYLLLFCWSKHWNDLSPWW